MARQLEGTHTFAVGESSVTLELGALVAARLRPPPCAGVLLDFPARVFQGAELIEEVIATFSGAPLRVGWDYRNEASAALQSVDLTLNLDGNGIVSARGSVQWHGEQAQFVQEAWDHPSNWKPFVPRPEFADACEEVRSTPFAAGSDLQFASEAEVQSALNGTWVLCEAPDIHSFVGVRIENGTWHHVVVGDQGLEDRYGFNHEGELRLFPGYDAPTYQINFVGLPSFGIGLRLHPEGLRTTEQAEPALGVGPSWNTSLVRATLPAATARDLPYSSGERAGVAACGAPELGILDPTSSAEAALQAFAGRWQRCSGWLPELLEFDTLGAVRVLDETGATAIEGQILFPNGFPDPMNNPGTLLTRMELAGINHTFAVAFSETPRKLALQTYNADLESLVTVYSALP